MPRPRRRRPKMQSELPAKQRKQRMKEETWRMMVTRAAMTGTAKRKMATSRCQRMSRITMLMRIMEFGHEGDGNADGDEYQCHMYKVLRIGNHSFAVIGPGHQAWQINKG
jgi:hypothetical protein